MRPDDDNDGVVDDPPNSAYEASCYDDGAKSRADDLHDPEGTPYIRRNSTGHHLRKCSDLLGELAFEFTLN